MSKIFLVLLLALPISIHASIVCEACQALVEVFANVADNIIGIDVAEGLATDICVKYKIELKDVCQGAVHEFAPELIYIAAHLSADERKAVCAKIELCPNLDPPHRPFGIRAPLGKKPLDAKSRQSDQPRPANSVGKFAHATDIHVDSRYTPGTNIDCGRPLCCRPEYGPPPKPELAAPPFGTLDGPCDLSPTTLDKLVASVAQHNPDFVLLTGDYPPHNVWEQSQDQNLGHLQQVSAAFGAAVQNPTYPCFGNHEAFPVNQFHGPGYDSWLYNVSAAMWAQWLPEPALKQLRYGGYYTTKIAPGLRLIALNSLLWMTYRDNYWQLLPESKTWQQEMLYWLDETLSAAYNASEKVYISTHVPWDDVILEYGQAVSDLLEHYTDTVVAIFGGHSHSDYWQLFKSNTTGKPHAIHFCSPSGTTYTGLHPSYRIFYYDTTTFELLDIETYFANITAANARGSVQFELAYNTRQLYGMSSLKPADWQILNDKLSKDDNLFAKYFKNFNQQQVAPPGPTRTCDTSCKKSLLCTLNTATSAEYKQCMGNTAKPKPEPYRH